jgi:anti-sigma regulatory factor (Ser/Thr protein kinase)
VALALGVEGFIAMAEKCDFAIRHHESDKVSGPGGLEVVTRNHGCAVRTNVGVPPHNVRK